jgi:hypothetical protein
MNAVLTQSAAQNDTSGVVILNPSAVLRMNSVKDLILKLSHYLFHSSMIPGLHGHRKVKRRTRI